MTRLWHTGNVIKVPSGVTHPRERLLTVARQRLTEAGPEALQARALTAEVGLSTMAIYTHFGGMNGLLEALVRDGFARLTATIGSVPRTVDPVADLAGIGEAYAAFARSEPRVYRLMFDSADLTHIAEATEAFLVVVSAVDRVMLSGRIRQGDPTAVAGQLWSAQHGFVLLSIVGFFGTAAAAGELILEPLLVSILIGLGDNVEAIKRSLLASRTSARTP